MYSVSEKDLLRLDNNFKHHPPKDEQNERYEQIRKEARLFALSLMQSCPPSRELSLALTHLEECVMNANASIARNE